MASTTETGMTQRKCRIERHNRTTKERSEYKGVKNLSLCVLSVSAVSLFLFNCRVPINSG